MMMAAESAVQMFDASRSPHLRRALEEAGYPLPQAPRLVWGIDLGSRDMVDALAYAVAGYIGRPLGYLMLVSGAGRGKSRALRWPQ